MMIVWQTVRRQNRPGQVVSLNTLATYGQSLFITIVSIELTSYCWQHHPQPRGPFALTGFGQYSIGFRRKSFCDGPRIVPEQDSWCHVDPLF